MKKHELQNIIDGLRVSIEADNALLKTIQQKIDSLPDELPTWIDPETKLEWESHKGEKMTWDEAKTYAESLGDGWKLPTRLELESLLNLDNYDPASSAPIDIVAGYYWSATTYAPSTTLAWGVVFSYGVVSSLSKTSSVYVRCVREVKDA
jgi:hypothetical protein